MPEEERLALAAGIREGLVRLGWLPDSFSITLTDTVTAPGNVVVTFNDGIRPYSLVRLPEETAYQLAFRLNSLATQRHAYNNFSSNIAEALRAHGLEIRLINIQLVMNIRLGRVLHVTVIFPFYGCDLEVEESLFRDPNGPTRIADQIIALINDSPWPPNHQFEMRPVEPSTEELPKTALERLLNEEEFL